MPYRRFSSPPPFDAMVSAPFVMAASLVAFGWLAMLVMVQPMIFDAGSIGPGMATASQLVLSMSGIPAELWQSLCRTDIARPFAWSTWSGACEMAAVMTLAMMLPCATPAWRMLRSGGSPTAAFGFMGGYGLLWMLFSAFLASIDTGLQIALGDHLVSTSGTAGSLAAGLLIVAGTYQCTAAKRRARLTLQRHDREPASDDRRARRPFYAGLHYAACCARSNGPLMSTMIVLGMMNIIAMSLLMLSMMLEKTTMGDRVSCATGAGLFAIGSAWLVAAFV